MHAARCDVRLDASSGLCATGARSNAYHFTTVAHRPSTINHAHQHFHTPLTLDNAL